MTQTPSIRSKRKRFILRGDWTDCIQCFTVDKITRKESKRESKRRRSDGSENSFASATSLESFSSGSSGGSVSVDTSVPKTLWRFQERPPNSKQVRIGNDQASHPCSWYVQQTAPCVLLRIVLLCWSCAWIRSSSFTFDCDYMKIIYVNCGWRRQYESDLRSNEHYLSSSEKRTEKISGLTSYQLVAQLVEHCTGIAEVMGSNPVQAWIFSGLIFSTAQVVFITAKITFIFTSFNFGLRNLFFVGLTALNQCALWRSVNTYDGEQTFPQEGLNTVLWKANADISYSLVSALVANYSAFRIIDR